MKENIHERLKKFNCPQPSSKEAMALEGPKLNESEMLNFLKKNKKR